MSTASFQEPTFGELMEQALNERLIDACSVDRGSVLIVRETDRFHMSREEGRTFLLGMLLGLWSCALNVPKRGMQPIAVDVPSVALGALAEETGAPWTTAKTEQRQERRLDRLVVSAQRLGIIEQAVKMPEEQKVMLVLPDTRVRMTYEEAAEYLRDCVIDCLGVRQWTARTTSKK